MIADSRTHNDRYPCCVTRCKMERNVDDPRPEELHDCTHPDTQRQVNVSTVDHVMAKFG